MGKAIDLRQSTSSPIAVDIGNKKIQDRSVVKTLQFALFTSNENAVWAAKQNLRKASYPFAVISFPANRNMFRLEVGDCFKFSYAPYNISNMICRVLQIEEENPDSENIIIHAMEDIFSVINTITEYTEPTDNTQPETDYTISPFTHQRIMEAPYVMTSAVKLLPVACRESDLDLGFLVYMSIDGGASYSLLDSVNNLQPYGTLVGTYSADTYTIDDEVGFTIDFGRDVDQIETVTWAEVFAATKNTALLGDEIISFQSITPVSGSQYKIEGIIRGRFGTTKQDHAEDTQFYFIHRDAALIMHSEIAAGADRKFKYLPYNVRCAGDIADAAALDLTIEGETLKPYIPVNFVANGGNFAARYDDDIVLAWSPRYRGKGAGIGIPGTVLADAEREGLFRVEVWVSGVKVRDTSGIDAATWTYTQAMNIADNDALAAGITFKLSNYRAEGGVTYESDQAEVTCKKN
jgi:hypothetical protein